MTLLITGAWGYLGGRFAQFLAERTKHEILLGTRAQRAPPSWLPKARPVRMQWDSTALLEQACDGVDAVIHMAGMNAQDCAADPVAALEFNGVATTRLLHAAIRNRVARFIHISTAHVYGSPLTGVITEKTCPDTLHTYATSHRAGEDALRAASQDGKIEGVVIRLSNAFGAPAHDSVDCWNLLLNDLCRQALTTGQMTLRSSGLQRRDFIPMTDACAAIAHLLRAPAQVVSPCIFNVGGAWSPTVLEVVRLVQQRCHELMGFQPRVSSIAPAAGESSPDLDYRIDALRTSGFQPGTDRMEEIDRLLGYCDKVFKNHSDR